MIIFFKIFYKKFVHSLKNHFIVVRTFFSFDLKILSFYHFSEWSKVFAHCSFFLNAIVREIFFHSQKWFPSLLVFTLRKHLVKSCFYSLTQKWYNIKTDKINPNILMLHSRPSSNTHYCLLLTLRRKYPVFLDDFPTSLEGKDDEIITEEDAEDISKTVEDEQRHLEDMDDLNLDDLNRKKRSVEAVDNTTSTTYSKDTHNFYQLLRFIQNEGLEGKYFIFD